MPSEREPQRQRDREEREREAARKRERERTREGKQEYITRVLDRRGTHRTRHDGQYKCKEKQTYCYYHRNTQCHVSVLPKI